jgi:hypothetical protein
MLGGVWTVFVNRVEYSRFSNRDRLRSFFFSFLAIFHWATEREREREKAMHAFNSHNKPKKMITTTGRVYYRIAETN